MTHQVEGALIEGLDFANFEDVLGLGHSKGFTSLLIPGNVLDMNMLGDSCVDCSVLNF